MSAYRSSHRARRIFGIQPFFARQADAYTAQNIWEILYFSHCIFFDYYKAEHKQAKAGLKESQAEDKQLIRDAKADYSEYEVCLIAGFYKGEIVFFASAPFFVENLIEINIRSGMRWMRYTPQQPAFKLPGPTG